VGELIRLAGGEVCQQSRCFGAIALAGNLGDTEERRRLKVRRVLRSNDGAGGTTKCMGCVVLALAHGCVCASACPSSIRSSAQMCMAQDGTAFHVCKTLGHAGEDGGKPCENHLCAGLHHSGCDLVKIGLL
jgi:hypothetical protein